MRRLSGQRKGIMQIQSLARRHGARLTRRRVFRRWSWSKLIAEYCALNAQMLVPFLFRRIYRAILWTLVFRPASSVLFHERDSRCFRASGAKITVAEERRTTSRKTSRDANRRLINSSGTTERIEMQGCSGAFQTRRR